MLENRRRDTGFAITSSGGAPIGDTGLALGGANLVPVKIDATDEYQLMSDFAAWSQRPSRC